MMLDLLRVFRAVVGGNLSPLYFTTNALEQPSWREPPLRIPKEVIQKIYVPFTQTQPELVLGKIEQRILTPSQLPAFLALNHSVRPYEEVSGETLLDFALKQLTIPLKAVQQWYHWQDESGKVHLELYAEFAVETLTQEELRYAYYQQLLREQSQTVREQLLAMVHGAASAKKGRKLLQDHQRALITLSEQVLTRLEENPEKVYTLSNLYTLPDIYKLIYQHIETLLLFLEEHLGAYLDLSVTVPYRRRLQAQQELEPIVERILTELSLPAELLAVLDEPFGEIKALKASSVTYRELYYLEQLVQTLDQAADLTEELVLSTLFQINFNSSVLLHYLVDQLSDAIQQAETPQQAQHVLHQARQQFQAWAGSETQAYRPGYPPIHQQLLRWIEDELAYREKKGVVIATEHQEEDTSTKVKTSLTVPQLALWLRLSNEVGIFPKQNLSNLCRQFSRILHSSGQETLSAESLRGKYYQHDERSIGMLKDKIFGMLNYLNQLAKKDG
ncbi:MAG: hypothetical protein ACFB15_28945 [Cyclobacteriaceae bacterium]